MIFSGVGNAFNTLYGNTSAYLKKHNEMILIDCGSSVFKSMKEQNAFVELERLTIIITHTHPDHVGSLGDLIFYAYFVCHIRPTIIFPNQALMTDFLRVMGVEPYQYALNAQDETILTEGAFGGFSVKFYLSQHVDAIPSYGLKLGFGSDTIYYSGDALTIPVDILDAFEKNHIQRIYQDVSCSTITNNVHLTLNQLNAIIPQAHRHRIFCMHYESDACVIEIKKCGYQTLRPYSAHDSASSL